MKKSLKKIDFLFYELNKMNNTRWWRWLGCWFTTSFLVIASYRMSRCFYLAFGGKLFVAIKLILSPVLFIIRPWIGDHEIHYRADIGKGLSVLHPSLGIVVSAATTAGQNLVLTGGNCIGGRRSVRHGDIIIGDNTNLGANAVILGPIRLGNNIQISRWPEVFAQSDSIARKSGHSGERFATAGRISW
jgi:serine O-acetyltransferase